MCSPISPTSTPACARARPSRATSSPSAPQRKSLRKEETMDRREFLKRAGVGSVALSSLPLLGERAWADSKPRIRESGKIFHFLALSAVPDTTDRLIIAGDGEFNAFVAEGGGSFDHFKAEGSPPLPLVATGTWTAHEV